MSIFSSFKEKCCILKLIRSKKNIEDDCNGRPFILILISFLLLSILITVVLGGIVFYLYVLFFGKDNPRLKELITYEGIKQVIFIHQEYHFDMGEWIHYENKDLGISLFYPQDWKLKNESGMVVLKEFNRIDSEDRDSLNMAISIGKLEIKGNPSMENFLKETQKNFKNYEIIKIGENEVHKMDHGKVGAVHRDAYYWNMAKSYYADVLFYNKRHDHADAEIAKILESIKFLGE